MKTIVYLHGFVSSPLSRKAVMLGDYLGNVAGGFDYVVPELSHRPASAIAQAAHACADVTVSDLTLVGSSLGGFYATVLAERIGCRAALLNPAVHPHLLFEKYLGARENLYTGEKFTLTREHIAQLRDMDPGAITNPMRYWLFAETGDVVLDYRDAVKLYDGALQTIEQGGDHTLVSFPEHVPEIVGWAKS